jgi:hypothetical protein
MTWPGSPKGWAFAVPDSVVNCEAGGEEKHTVVSRGFNPAGFSSGFQSCSAGCAPPDFFRKGGISVSDEGFIGPIGPDWRAARGSWGPGLGEDGDCVLRPCLGLYANAPGKLTSEAAAAIAAVEILAIPPFACGKFNAPPALATGVFMPAAGLASQKILPARYSSSGECLVTVPNGSAAMRGDPADRLVMATAISPGLPLITADRKLQALGPGRTIGESTTRSEPFLLSRIQRSSPKNSPGRATDSTASGPWAIGRVWQGPRAFLRIMRQTIAWNDLRCLWLIKYRLLIFFRYIA